MADLEKLVFSLSALSIYKNVLKAPVPAALFELIKASKGDPFTFGKCWGGFFSALCTAGHCDNLKQCIENEILCDDNPFTRAASANTPLPENVLDAVENDLLALEEMASLRPIDFFDENPDVDFARLPIWQNGKAEVLCDNWGEKIDVLREYHKKKGFGIFARYHAFVWGKGIIRPVKHVDVVELSSLKGYEMERQLVVNNTLAFLEGRPANNVLLYGDRGTGKSSTVKAVLNEFKGKGLKMVEVPKESLGELARLNEMLAEIPLYFIVFVDDLSFSGNDDSFSSLKAVLEGGLVGKPSNTLIYATSNRRHLVRESFSDRAGDDIHEGDTIEETLSLSDRFGITVTFSLPNKKQYLDIVYELAKDYGVEMEKEKLEKGAERWALLKGGRSPRIAKQYVIALKSGYFDGLDDRDV